MSKAAERLHLYAAAMDIDVPELELEDGELLITPAVLRFCQSEGISLDWLATGKAATPADPALVAMVDRLSPHEQESLFKAVIAHKQGMDWQAALDKYLPRS